MKIALLIPARIGSTRLNRKMLQLIGNKPLVCQVVNRAQESNIKRIIVATDSEEIAIAVKNEGAECIMTSANHASGSDRVYEALTKIDPDRTITHVINLQGDMPFINPSIFNQLTEAALHSEADILTPVCAIPSTDSWKINDHSIVKPVIAFYSEKLGKALYFSRQPIPHDTAQYYEHIGVYLYKRKALESFVAAAPHDLEKCERLEQLRALALGMSIDVCVTTNAPTSVDTDEDLKRARVEYQCKFRVA